eukprot:TRINITY_DN1951_c0_g1_i1.p1 TRINITY_DN1951_c0_g1~~TRINITY_DN1951_c0_g1_i1.p1  ORF type:complete len:838 (+),score=192.69 TRINITY_DN1951_c0_g1_i1:108-2516(+)
MKLFIVLFALCVGGTHAVHVDYHVAVDAVKKLFVSTQHTLRQNGPFPVNGASTSATDHGNGQDGEMDCSQFSGCFKDMCTNTFNKMSKLNLSALDALDTDDDPSLSNASMPSPNDIKTMSKTMMNIMDMMLDLVCDIDWDCLAKTMDSAIQAAIDNNPNSPEVAQMKEQMAKNRAVAEEAKKRMRTVCTSGNSNKYCVTDMAQGSLDIQLSQTYALDRRANTANFQGLAAFCPGTCMAKMADALVLDPAVKEALKLKVSRALSGVCLQDASGDFCLPKVMNRSRELVGIAVQSQASSGPGDGAVLTIPAWMTGTDAASVQAAVSDTCDECTTKLRYYRIGDLESVVMLVMKSSMGALGGMSGMMNPTGGSPPPPRSPSMQPSGDDDDLNVANMNITMDDVNNQEVMLESANVPANNFMRMKQLACQTDDNTSCPVALASAGVPAFPSVWSDPAVNVSMRQVVQKACGHDSARRCMARMFRAVHTTDLWMSAVISAHCAPVEDSSEENSSAVEAESESDDTMFCGVRFMDSIQNNATVKYCLTTTSANCKAVVQDATARLGCCLRYYIDTFVSLENVTASSVGIIDKNAAYMFNASLDAARTMFMHVAEAQNITDLKAFAGSIAPCTTLPNPVRKSYSLPVSIDEIMKNKAQWVESARRDIADAAGVSIALVPADSITFVAGSSRGARAAANTTVSGDVRALVDDDAEFVASDAVQVAPESSVETAVQETGQPASSVDPTAAGPAAAEGGKSNTGRTIGIAVGVVLGVALLAGVAVVAVMFMMKKKTAAPKHDAGAYEERLHP